MSTAVIRAPFVRQWLSANAVFLGGGIAARSLNASATSGFFVEPIKLPPNANLNEPITIRFLLVLPNLIEEERRDLVFSLVWGVGPADGTVDGSSLQQTVSLPPPLGPSDTLTVDFNDGTGVTFPGGTFAPGDTVGMRIERNGADPNDDWPASISVPEFLEMTLSVL